MTPVFSIQYSVISRYTLFTGLLVWSVAANAAGPEARLADRNQVLLNKYCMDCHDADTEKGDVNLEDLPFHITTMQQAELWQKVLNAMNSGEMPPEKKPQPQGKEKADFLDDLSFTMVMARKVLSDSGGKITMRRLNKREYIRTIEELLGVTPNTESLPEDGGADTFDTEGASQFMSSDQVELYLELGRKAIDEAFARQASKGAVPKTFRVEPEKVVNPHHEKILKDYEKRHVGYLRWKEGVDKAASLPVNKAAVEKIKASKGGLRKLYGEAESLKGIPDPKKHGFKDVRTASFFGTRYERSHALFKHYTSLPHLDRGSYLMLANLSDGWQRVDVEPKWKMPAGSYILRVKAGLVEGVPAHRRFIEIGHPDLTGRKKQGILYPLSSHEVRGTIAKPSIIEIPVEVGAETPRIFSVREKQPADGNAFYKQTFNVAKKKNGYGHEPAIWVDWVELKGPLKPAATDPNLNEWWVSKENVPDEQARARKILEKFAVNAFREATPGKDYLNRLISIFNTRRKSGESFDVAIRTPLSIILASPGFLYFNEPGQKKERRLLTDRELAVRLAYFLWSAPPDEQLLSLADKKQLHEPKVLHAQVKRMITDPRSDSFIEGFVPQWLHMERLDFFQFDIKRHPEFDDSMREASRQEVYESYAHLLKGKEGGSLKNLLKSDYVVINALLAFHYGIPGVVGDHFRKVSLPANSPRGGLLGMAAVHAMGSDGVQSSPVERGAWVLRYVLNDPPPPAPANVPQLSRLNDQKLTVRERVSAHQEEPQCASCHRKIDPIGFGLENFTASGLWRTSYASVAGKQTKAEKRINKAAKKAGKTKTPVAKPVRSGIDASGKFHNGPAFKDYYELRDKIAEQHESFARGYTEALIAYGLGRPFGFTDEDLADRVMATGRKYNYNAASFIHAVVASKEFKSK